MKSTLTLLQAAVEDRLRRDPAEFDRLELDDKGFQGFAFSTHAQAYVDGGILTLPASDLWRILRTPDMTDVVSPGGITEILVLLAELGRNDVARIVAPTSDGGLRHGSGRTLAWILGRIRSHLRRPKSPAT